MEMEEECYFYTVVNQHSAPPSIRTWAEDKVLITLYLYKVRAVQTNSSMLVSYEQHSQIAHKFVTIVLSSFKRPRNANRYARKLLDVLTSMGVPHVEQPKVVQKLLPVLAAAVSTNSIDVVVFDTTHIYPRSYSRDGDGDGNIYPRDGDGDGDGDGNIYPRSGDGDGHVAPPKLIPASTSSIQGLEPVTIDDNTVIKETPECPICLENFVAAASVGNITALPCTHHFHVHCIVQWMEISHLCPLCRYAMPVEDDHSN